LYSRAGVKTENRGRELTAGGRDGFRYIPIIRLHEILPQILPDLFNPMFKYSAHPVEWKVANWVVVAKQGKATYQDPKSYRPISLLS
jgi:hypothetical protein